ncbi:MAG: TraB/GumN family protein, partial [Rhizomicrobium sp.]
EQPDGQTLRATLPSDLRARYEAWMAKLGKDADANDDYLAAIAALNLENAFRRKYDLDGRETGHAIERMADHAEVQAQPLAVYPALPVADDVQAMSPQAEQQCMRDALDDIDTQSVNARLAAQAWATGDLAGMKAHYSETKLNGCFEQTKTFAAARDQIVGLAMNAVNESLSKPGKYLIVIDIGYLLRNNGLLDRLAAQGITVEGPSN